MTEKLRLMKDLVYDANDRPQVASGGLIKLEQAKLEGEYS
jgi:hypothetical protein